MTRGNTPQRITDSMATDTRKSRWPAELPVWTVVAPLVAALVLAAAAFDFGASGPFVAIIALSLAGSVFAAVHHAEVVAHRVGEPYGTLVLALAVTLIEVALIVSLMIAGGAEAAALARDTVFAAVMIILNGIIGLCLLVGGLKHREQSFSLDGVSAALVALAAIVVLALVFPNYTSHDAGSLLLVQSAHAHCRRIVGDLCRLRVCADRGSSPDLCRG